MRENTIGVVHWEALQTGYDGERFLVIIPAFFQSQHVPYLEAILKSRVAEINGGIAVSLNPGRFFDTSNRTGYEPGTIVLADVAEPWPDAAGLRASLDAAFVEAGEIEVEQRRLARDLEKHLRSAPPAA
ncbi:MAG: hypothetical protein WA484_16070 [Solirubrobacteraceae bacterium]